MADYYAEAGEDTPEITLDSQAGSFVIRGKAYPENAVSVFKPVIDTLQEILPAYNGAALRVDFDLTYFNSSSAKALMRLGQILEDHAEKGLEIDLHWHYPEDDEALQEFGEDLAEDMEAVTFTMAPYAQA